MGKLFHEHTIHLKMPLSNKHTQWFCGWSYGTFWQDAA